MMILGAGPAQDWAARFDVNGHEEGDAEKMHEADRRQILFHLSQRCVRPCERAQIQELICARSRAN